MSYIVFATNKLDRDEYYTLGQFDTEEEAQWNIDHNIE